MTWTLTIPLPLPSQNRAPHNQSFVASHHYRRARNQWASVLSLHARVAGVPMVTADYQPLRRVVITRLWGKGQRELDKANAWGGIKLILDCMCPPKVTRYRLTKGGAVQSRVRPGASLIVDDSPKWLDVDVTQEKAADGVAATRIMIADMEAK